VSGEEGLGLVEVLVAVAILGMTVVALLAAISTVRRRPSIFSLRSLRRSDRGPR